MRIYGSSPLHNYVELIFRCKRMFIVSLIIGTVITSAVVAMRKDKYEASIMVALSGDPELAANLSGRVDVSASASRKANRLALWMAKTPDFMKNVVKYAGDLSRKHPDIPADKMVKKVRDSISGPSILNDQYMELSIVWDNQQEANDILNSLYSQFSEKTVATETTNVTRRRQILEEDYKRYNDDANRQTMARMRYQQAHYWQLPTLLSSEMSRLDTTETQVAALKVDQKDAVVRLDEVNRQLSVIPKEMVESTTKSTTTADPALKLISDKQELETSLKRLLTVYSPMHPKVQELQRNISALDQQIKDARSNKAAPTGSNVQETRSINPAWRDLMQQQSSLTILIRAQERRLSQLISENSLHHNRVQQMPMEDVTYSKIEREYNMASTIRNNTESALKAAQIDEDRAKRTEALAVQLLVPPDALRQEASGRGVLLYAMGPLLGILIAFCFSLAAEALDHTLRTPVEVEQYLGKPVLAVIPRAKPSAEAQKQLGGSSNQGITS